MFNAALLGKRIRLIRGKKSQDVFADELGISRGALSFYENGERKPDAEIIYKICDHCKVSSDYLLGFTDNATTDTDLQAICNYTGLSVEAVKGLNNTFKVFNQSELIETLSWLISENHINALVFYLTNLKNSSLDYVELYNNHNTRDLEDLDLTCDLIRYSLIKLTEKLSNIFDQREQVNENGNNNPKNE